MVVAGTTGEQYSDLGVKILSEIDSRRTSAPDISKVDLLEKALVQADTFTFLGHGEYDWNTPEDSFIELIRFKNEKISRMLSLESFIQAISPCQKVIILAACEVGLPQIRTQITDYHGFAEDLLLCKNVKVVISTLWSIFQLSTVLLIHKLHTYLLIGDPIHGHGPM